MNKNRFYVEGDNLPRNIKKKGNLAKSYLDKKVINVRLLL